MIVFLKYLYFLMRSGLAMGLILSLISGFFPGGRIRTFLTQTREEGSDLMGLLLIYAISGTVIPLF